MNNVLVFLCEEKLVVVVVAVVVSVGVLKIANNHEIENNHLTYKPYKHSCYLFLKSSAISNPVTALVLFSTKRVIVLS